MDVPFISSGAMSRAQYALVRKIETATTPQAADQLLFAEVDAIRMHLGQPTLSLVCRNILCTHILEHVLFAVQKQCKENLILLLYCVMTLSPGLTADIDFAPPHAINLAEAGHTVHDKRIGMVFLLMIDAY